ncbi:hypothetical protein ACOMHN_012017 [Nucella lapillus]
MGYPNHWCHCHMLQDDSREEELLGDGEMSLSQWLGDEIAITGDEISITENEIDLTDEDLTEIANQMFANCPPSTSLFPTQAQLPTQAPAPRKRRRIYPLSTPPTVIDYRDPSCSPRIYNGPLYSLLSRRWMSSEGSQWSRWYNSDSPWQGEGDNETVHRISLVLGLPCALRDITSVQCRRRSSNNGEEGGGAGGATFQDQSVYKGNVLQVPCNTSGLMCRHEDQKYPPSSFSSSSPSLTMCADYEIRLLCLETDTKKNSSHDAKAPKKDDITSHAAFIAIVASGSIVVPLILVLIFRFRKNKLTQLQRQLEQQQSPASAELEEEEERRRREDAPPAYDLLFGNPEPVPATFPEVNDVVGGNGANRSTERLIHSHVPSETSHVGQGEVNLSLEPEELSTSEEPRLAPATERPTTAVSPPSSERIASSRGSSSGPSTTSRVTPTTLPATAASDSRLRRVSSESSNSSASSTRAFLTSRTARALRPSQDDVTHNDPPPAYDWPGHAIPSHVTVVMPAGDATSSNAASSEESSDSSSVSNRAVLTQPAAQASRLAQRRFTGMHLSILDIMSIIYPVAESDPVATPPPTYDDALKILEESEQLEIRVQ